MRIAMVMGIAAAVGIVQMTEVAKSEAQAETIVRLAQAAPSDTQTQPRRPRARVRIYRDMEERGVYPSYYPGPNAVRDCTATYVQEFRPSGTVITPRMNCYWRRG